MSSAVFGNARPIRRGTKPIVFASCAIFLVFMIVRLAIQYNKDGGFYLEDDAYYYTIIAGNVAENGLSTFDSQTLTNGYHPLWLLLLALQAKVLGGSALVTMSIELLLVAVGLWFSIASFRSRSALFRITFTLLFCLIAWPMIAKGMEVSLFIFAFGLFLKTTVGFLEGEAGSLMLGAAAVLCIGARIDSGVFVLPILILACGTLRRASFAIMPVAFAGAIYAAVNLWVFGLPMPVSGAIKSLGGFQWNGALIDQIESYWHRNGPLRATISFLNSYFGRTLFLFILPCVALPWLDRRAKSWVLVCGFAAGFCLFAIKLLLFSSWVIWPWYGFPAVMGLCVSFHIVDDLLDGYDGRNVRWIEGVATAAALVATLTQLKLAETKDFQSFEPINAAAASKFASVFGGDRVAMGDRAGSFALRYAGPVTQLEGIVNDRTYFDAVEHHQDVRPLLCRRGVKYVLSYERDLGRYDETTVHVLRHQLTHFPSPTLTFKSSDEVGRVSDLTRYDNTSIGNGDNYLYAWRLSGCGPASRGSEAR